ncbi:MAG: hypothetical protein JW881_05950 [Spirochaetales bacterium]|nr:hypothetical protein [Spirochaetales bacterium]
MKKTAGPVIIMLMAILPLFSVCTSVSRQNEIHDASGDKEDGTFGKDEEQNAGLFGSGKTDSSLHDDKSDTGAAASPAPFRREKVHDEIAGLFHYPDYPLVNNKKILYLIHDFTQDDVEEVCVLSIKSDDPANAQLEFISDFSRLFKEKREVFPFFFNIFSLHNDSYSLVNSIALGEHSVYGSITKFNLDKNQPDPVVIAVSFQTKEGSVQEWLVFKSPVIYPVATVSLKETVSVKTIVEDIDNDGILDILLYERGMEEGVGYETFLTWKRWNKKRFIEYKTINIVRNLNGFLEGLREICLTGSIEQLLSYSLDPAEKRKFEKSGMTQQQILFNLFGLSRFFEQDLTGINVLDGIEEVVFPEILDNPFYVKDGKGSYFKLSFRIIYGNGLSVIPEVLIYMLKNPFGKRQFVLYPIPAE